MATIRRAVSASAANAARLIELRTYRLKVEHMPDYLKLTGSPAFEARREASELVGFWTVEMGGMINTAVHLWAYDDLDHRASVRAELSSNRAFLSYFSTIRPWLETQESVLCSTDHRSLVQRHASNGSPRIFALVTEVGSSAAPEAPTVELVESFVEEVGQRGRRHSLFAASSFEVLRRSFLEVQSVNNARIQFLTPTSFSPMK